MNPPSISSRCAVWLGWWLLCLVVLFAPSQAGASFTDPSGIIAPHSAPQVAAEWQLKLEIGTGLFCGNDPVNRHDPLGLATDEERTQLQSTSAKLMEVIGLLGGKPWTPEEVFNEKLQTTSFLGIPQNPGLAIPLPFGIRIPLDNKAQLRSHYPSSESDQDVALRESVRSNSVQVKALLARAGKLPKDQVTALQLRGLGLMAETTVDLAVTLAPYDALPALASRSVLGTSQVLVGTGVRQFGAATEREILNIPAVENEGSRLLLGPGPKYNPWAGSITSEVTSAETTMFRVWGDGADKVGGWLTPTPPASQLSAIRDLALPVENSAQWVSEVVVPAGTRIQIGTAGRAFGQPGGAPQILLLDRISPADFGPGVSLGPRR